MERFERLTGADPTWAFMLPALSYAAFGWLAFCGVGHFLADALMPLLRKTGGERRSSAIAVDVSFAIGQFLFGLAGIVVTWQAPTALGGLPFTLLAIASAALFGAFALTFLTHWQPKALIAVYAILVIAAIVVDVLV